MADYLTKNSNQASLVHMKYLESLMNMNSRSRCPRCQGKGFVHNIKKQHSKPSLERCKSCSHCSLCDGSGVLIKLAGCSNCKGNGFVHHFRTESEKHNLPFRVRCALCVDCYKCRGKGAIDPEAVSQSLYAVNASTDVDTSQNFHAISDDLIVKPAVINSSVGISTLDSIHPHLRGVLDIIERDIGKKKLEKRLLKYCIGIPTQASQTKFNSPLDLANQLTFNMDLNSHSIENITPDTPTNKSIEEDLGPKFIQFRNIMNSTTTVEDQDEGFVNVVKADEQDIKSKVQRHSCPKCNGKGWTHTGSAKHSKRKHVKCEYCTDCSGCDGSGLVSGKIACIKCETRGFFHPSNEREHDLPFHLRCFYCRPCRDCQGSGLVDSKIVKPLQLLNINF